MSAMMFPRMFFRKCLRCSQICFRRWKSFGRIDISDRLFEGIHRKGIERPTEIQEKVGLIDKFNDFSQSIRKNIILTYTTRTVLNYQYVMLNKKQH